MVLNPRTNLPCSNQDRGSPLDASSRKSRLSLAVGGPPEGFEQGKLLRLLRRPFRGGRQSLAKDRAHSELSCRRDHFYGRPPGAGDRKSTRLNSSHGYISYAVFCLKKKKNFNL